MILKLYIKGVQREWVGKIIKEKSLTPKTNIHLGREIKEKNIDMIDDKM